MNEYFPFQRMRYFLKSSDFAISANGLPPDFPESSRGFVVLSRKRPSIRGAAFWHTLFGHHRPGEAVLAAPPARGGPPHDIALAAPADRAADFYYDPANPLGPRYPSLRAIADARGALEGVQYAPVVHVSGYLSDEDPDEDPDEGSASGSECGG